MASQAMSHTYRIQLLAPPEVINSPEPMVFPTTIAVHVLAEKPLGGNNGKKNVAKVGKSSLRHSNTYLPYTGRSTERGFWIGTDSNARGCLGWMDDDRS